VGFAKVWVFPAWTEGKVQALSWLALCKGVLPIGAEGHADSTQGDVVEPTTLLGLG
jgi:hypothetical protein